MRNLNIKQLTMVCSLIIVFCLASAFQSSAQVIGMKETIDYLNKKFNGKCEFQDKKKYINVVFTKGGEEYRFDRLYLIQLNYEDVKYVEDEGGIVLSCKEDQKGCIPRKIPKLKIVDDYSRILFKMDSSNQKEIESVKSAFIHLIKLAYFDDMNRTEPFE